MVDRRNHHLFQPMLYQVATAALNPGDIAAPIRSVLRRQRNAEVLLARGRAGRHRGAGSTAHRRHEPRIRLPGRWHRVRATPTSATTSGSRSRPGLKNLEDALEIRRRVLLAFERAEREPDPVRRHALPHLRRSWAAGPTGVEMAGAVAEIRGYALRRDFRHIDPGEATVMLLEGGPRLLPAYPASSERQGQGDLRRLGVDVRTETLVTDIDARRPCIAAGWTIPTQTVIWAAGNTASPLLKTLGAPLDRQGRVVVEPDCTHPRPSGGLRARRRRRTSTTTGSGTLPGICPVAIQMGEYAAARIEGDLAGRPRRPSTTGTRASSP